MKKRYGVVLVGCGYIGEAHLADIHYRDNIRMIAVVDTDITRAASLAKKYCIPEYGTDYLPYIKRKETDIVIIATYVDTHYSIMKDCVANGCHVLCEKPVAASREVGELFFRTAKAAPTQVLIGHELRYNRSYQKIENMIREGAIGKLQLIRIIQNHHAVNWTRYTRLMQDCPPVLDCGVHYLDIMRWLSGEEIESVTSIGCYLDVDAPCPNYATTMIRLSGNIMGYYECGWSRNLKACNTKEFIGEKGYLRLTLMENRISEKEEGDLIEWYYSPTGEYQTINLKSKYKDMYAQLSELIKRIEDKPTNSFALEDARVAFLAACEAKESVDEYFSVLMG